MSITKTSVPAGSPMESFALPAATNGKLEEYNVAIAQAKRTTLEGIFAIGSNLETVHDLLAGHGNEAFCRWAKDCGFTAQTAQILRDLAHEIERHNPEFVGAEDEVPLRQEAAPDVSELISEVDDDENPEPEWKEAFSTLRYEDEE